MREASHKLALWRRGWGGKKKKSICVVFFKFIDAHRLNDCLGFEMVHELQVP